MTFPYNSLYTQAIPYTSYGESTVELRKPVLNWLLKRGPAPVVCANVKICRFCFIKKKTNLKLFKFAEILDCSFLFGVMLLTIVCSSGEPVAGAVNCYGCDLSGWAMCISYLVHKLTCLHFPNLNNNGNAKETRLNPVISQYPRKMLLVLL